MTHRFDDALWSSESARGVDSGDRARARCGVFRLEIFPDTRAAVLKLQERRVESAQALALLETDPGLVLSLLGTEEARAAKSRCHREALEVVGLEGLAKLVSELDTLPLELHDADALREARRQMIATARIAATLADSVGLHPDDAYAAALVHDIGRIVLSTTIGSTEEEERPGEDRGLDTAAHLERHRHGFDHGTLGAVLARQVNAPQWLVTIISWHHHPGLAYSAGGWEARMVALLRTASLLRREIERGGPRDEKIALISREGAASYLELGPADLLSLWEGVEATASHDPSALPLGSRTKQVEPAPDQCVACDAPGPTLPCRACGRAVCAAHRKEPDGWCPSCALAYTWSPRAPLVTVSLVLFPGVALSLLGAALGLFGSTFTAALCFAVASIASLVTWVLFEGYRRYAFTRSRSARATARSSQVVLRAP